MHTGILQYTLISINKLYRLLLQYYDPDVLPTVKDQKAFEKNLFQKTSKANGK